MLKKYIIIIFNYKHISTWDLLIYQTKYCLSSTIFDQILKLFIEY